jgi:protein-S-isoprenylcysteine O-methyltransferase Ste14
MSVETKSGHTLITTGPYRWVRHPLYSGLLNEAIGVSLFVANWFVASTAAATWALLAYRTRIEEDKLVEEFGEEYKEYQRCVGMFVPRMGRNVG